MKTTKEIATILTSVLVQTLDPVPEGHLYSACMGQCDLDTFQLAVGAPKVAGLLENTGGSRFLVAATDKARALPWPPSINVARHPEGARPPR